MLTLDESGGDPLGGAHAGRSLRRRGGRYGVATMCVGVGQGQAALFESR